MRLIAIKECNHKHSCGCIVAGSCIDHVPIFGDLTEAERESILQTSLHKLYNKGDFIFMPGDHFSNLFVVVEGLVKIVKYSTTGKEQILSLLHPGDFIGELYLFSNKETNNAAYAVVDTTVCIIEGEAIKKYILNNPEVALKFLEKYTERMLETENLVEQISLRDVSARLAHFLVNEANNKEVITLSTTKRDLAAMLGITPETLSRKLNEFQSNGWIRMSGQRKIEILNKYELENLYY